MGIDQKIKMSPKRCDWSEACEVILAEACGDDLAIIRDQVNAEHAELWAFPGDHYAVMREDHFGDSVDLVVLVIGGPGGGEGGDVARFIVDFARANAAHRGYRRLRFHTTRRGLPRWLAHAGVSDVQLMERVYEIPFGGE